MTASVAPASAPPVKDKNGVFVNPGDSVTHNSVGPGKPMTAVALQPNPAFASSSLFAFDGLGAWYLLDASFTKS